MSEDKLEQLLEKMFGAVAKRAAVGEVRRSAFVPEVRQVDEQKRTITFVASTEAVDRYGDVLRASGWDLANYRKNPVFLWGHRSGDPPIGRTLDVHVETSPKPALVQTVEFADAATYPFADQVYRLYKGKFLNSVSVGFRPLEKPKFITDPETGAVTGYEFTRQELLELSAVPLPANPEAVARALGAGIVSATDAEKFFTAGGDVIVPDDPNAPATEEDCERLLAAYDRLAETVAGHAVLRPFTPVVNRIGDRVLALTGLVRQQQRIKSVAELERLLRLG